MKLERVRSGVFRLTLHAFELSALVAAARVVAVDGDPRISPEAAEQLQGLLMSYDAEVRRVNDEPPDGPP